MWVRPLGWEYTLEEGMASPLVFLPRESHGQKSLTGNSPQGRKESDMTEATQHMNTHKFIEYLYSFIFFIFYQIYNEKELAAKKFYFKIGA